MKIPTSPQCLGWTFKYWTGIILRDFLDTLGKAGYFCKQNSVAMTSKKNSDGHNPSTRNIGMINPVIVYPVKMEYGWNFTITGLKMMLNTGLEKISLKFFHAQAIFDLLIYFIEKRIFAQNQKFSNKNDLLCAWRDFKENNCGVCK